MRRKVKKECYNCEYKDGDKSLYPCNHCKDYSYHVFATKCCEKCKFFDKGPLDRPCGNCDCTFNEFVEDPDWHTRCYGDWTPDKPYYEDDPSFSAKCDCMTDKPEADVVNHPSHYETGKFQCIDVMVEALGREEVKGFCICNAFKYLYRCRRKNGLEDIKKAKWYIDKFIELCEEDE